MLSALLVAGLATSCSDKSDGSGLTKFNIGHLPATGHILYFIAYEEGFFKDEGLDVTLTQYSNNTEELAALEAGKIDVTKNVNNDIYTTALEALISEDPDNAYYQELSEYHKTAVAGSASSSGSAHHHED